MECESLIPLRFECNKVILVGDPQQLPATIISHVIFFHTLLETIFHISFKKAQVMGLKKSLFQRVNQCFKFDDYNPIQMLLLQYRMHPEICNFPSKLFYKRKLITDS